MDKKMFFTAVVITSVISPIVGMALAKRQHRKAVERTMRIKACEQAYSSQMQMYRDDPRMQYETFAFWYQIVNDEMI